MRKNRKVSKRMSVNATITMRFAAVIVIFFVMVILNILSSSSCTQLMKEKGEKEREIAKLDEAKSRESTRWDEMCTPERIEKALIRHGLQMKPPRPEQAVVMLANGKPRPDQFVLRKARSNMSVLADVGVAPTSVRSSYRRQRSR